MGPFIFVSSPGIRAVRIFAKAAAAKPVWGRRFAVLLRI
jgi:hypothetical protein